MQEKVGEKDENRGNNWMDYFRAFCSRWNYQLFCLFFLGVKIIFGEADKLSEGLGTPHINEKFA